MAAEPSAGHDVASVSREARAMGTDVVITVVGSDAHTGRLADAGLSRIRELEAMWSRFLPDSEISRLNGAEGRPVEVSPETRLLLATAIEAWRISGGLVDCTSLDALVKAGYDRSFEMLAEDRSHPRGADRPEAPHHRTGPRIQGPTDIVVDGGAASLPIGLGLDPGGIGKGLAADLVARELMAAGADGVCVDVGGDLRIRGVGPTGGGWTISIDHPHCSETLALVGIADGAVASSTTLKRTWRVDGERRHHLIDPRTGRPSTSDVVFSSAIAREGWLAETMAKATLLRGGPNAFDLVDGSGTEVLVVGADGVVSTSRGFERFCGVPTGAEAPA